MATSTSRSFGMGNQVITQSALTYSEQLPAPCKPEIDPATWAALGSKASRERKPKKKWGTKAKR